MSDSNPQLLSERDAARILAVSARTLENWRRTGSGPAFVKLAGGRNVRYPVDGLHEWIADNLRTSLSDPGPEDRATV